MGLCASQAAPTAEELRETERDRTRCREIDKQIKESRQADHEVKKLLFLGSGGSGKSTLFKQMQTIYGSGFSEEERKSYACVIHSNVLVSIKTLLEQAPVYGGCVENKESCQVLLEVSDSDVFDVVRLGPHVKAMWQDPGVQAAYVHRAKFSLLESTEYYFSKIDEIMQPTYLPTEADILRSRMPTTGIVDCQLEIPGMTMKVLDVGGQRSERKKWIHCFQSVTAVLFVTDVNAYDETLYEDDRVSRMTDSLDLFGEIANSAWFQETPMILFLNKKDLFAEKIQRVPLRNYFPLFTGNSYNEAIAFVQDMFSAKTQQKIYVHITCATDTALIATVFELVKNIIIKTALNDAGLV